MTTTAEAAVFSPLNVGANYPNPEQTWIDADAVPAIQTARSVGFSVARRLLDERVQQLCEGAFDEVPNPVDPLTTAGRAIDAKNRYGESSEAYRQAYHSLVVDSQRLWAEAMRKLTWEYFPEIEQPYDEQAGGYSFMGRRLLDMVQDGITPVAEAEEQQYRLGEYVEEVTYGAVRRYGKVALSATVERPEMAVASRDTRVFTISECADWAIAAHAKKSKAGYGGYVPEIEKLMIRGVRYDAVNGNRYQEQLGLPGTYITHDIINEALCVLGISGAGQKLSKVEVRSKQLIGTGGEDVLAFAALLDNLASRASGKRIFLGEVIAENQPKDYGAIKQEAANRQAQLLQESHALADFLISLEESGVDHWEAQGIVEHYVKKMIFQKVKDTPEQARIVFDSQTADKLEQAACERRQGNEMAARSFELQAEQNAPPAVFCGAGSCGLEDVDSASKEVASMKDKLDAKTGDQMVRDTERACRKCGRVGSVYYVYNAKKVNKGCASCGAVKKK